MERGLEFRYKALDKIIDVRLEPLECLACNGDKLGNLPLQGLRKTEIIRRRKP